MDSLLRAVLKFRLDNPDLLGSLQSLVSITSKAINTIASTSANGKSSVSSDATENDGETKATSSPSFFSADTCVFLKTDPREIQSMIISHSRFDTIMYRDAMGDVEDRFTDTHRIAIVRLLQSLTNSSLTLLSSESTEESSILKMNAQAKLLGSLMPAYSATLSKLDRCILSIVQQEQNAMAFASDSPSTSNSSSGSGDSRTRNLMLLLMPVFGERQQDCDEVYYQEKKGARVILVELICRFMNATTSGFLVDHMHKHLMMVQVRAAQELRQAQRHMGLILI